MATPTIANTVNLGQSSNMNRPDYEKVTVRLRTAKPKTSKSKKFGNRALYQSIFYVLCVLMLIVGVLTGLGLFTLHVELSQSSMQRNNVTNENTCLFYARTSGSFFQSEKECIFDSGATNTCYANMLCSRAEWWLDTRGTSGEVVSIFNASSHVEPFSSDFLFPANVSCGPVLRCDNFNQCKPLAEQHVAGSPLQRMPGQWQDVCPHSLPCLKFVNRVLLSGQRFDSAASQSSWAQLAAYAYCDQAIARAYCAKYTRVVSTVLRVQFRKCVGSGARRPKCDGLPMQVYPYKWCPESVDEGYVNETRDAVCRSVGGPAVAVQRSQGCAVQCGTSQIVRPMPAGLKCGQDSYCLLGECYQMANGTAPTLKC